MEFDTPPMDSDGDGDGDGVGDADSSAWSEMECDETNVTVCEMTSTRAVYTHHHYNPPNLDIPVDIRNK